MEENKTLWSIILDILSIVLTSVLVPLCFVWALSEDENLNSLEMWISCGFVVTLVVLLISWLSRD